MFISMNKLILVICFICLNNVNATKIIQKLHKYHQHYEYPYLSTGILFIIHFIIHVPIYYLVRANQFKFYILEIFTGCGYFSPTEYCNTEQNAKDCGVNAIVVNLFIHAIFLYLKFFCNIILSRI